jgi:beta-galactosidase
MKTNREYERFERIGVEKPRSYYIPYAKGQGFTFKNRILNRQESCRFISLDGTWLIKEHKSVEDVEIGERLKDTIPVPSCVQMHGYDQIQYINA